MAQVLPSIIALVLMNNGDEEMRPAGRDLAAGDGRGVQTTGPVETASGPAHVTPVRLFLLQGPTSCKPSSRERAHAKREGVDSSPQHWAKYGNSTASCSVVARLPPWGGWPKPWGSSRRGDDRRCDLANEEVLSKEASRQPES